MNKNGNQKKEAIFTKDQPIAAAVGFLVIVLLFCYFSWIVLDRFIELVNAFSTGQIEAHFSSLKSHASWSKKSDWHEHPWHFFFSVLWVAFEMIAVALLCCGCIQALRNLTPGMSSANKNK